LSATGAYSTVAVLWGKRGRWVRRRAGIARGARRWWRQWGGRVPRQSQRRRWCSGLGVLWPPTSPRLSRTASRWS